MSLKEIPKGLESRITAGPISNLIAPQLVNREGFCLIFAKAVPDTGKNYVKYFKLLMENNDVFDNIGRFSDEERTPTGAYPFLNEGLKKAQLYLAHFNPCLPQFTNPSGEKVIGTADVYSERNITVDNRGNFRKVNNQPVPADLLD